MTPEEYIVLERAALQKHDYINGEAVLRTGAEKFQHNQMQTDLLIAFYESLDAVDSVCGVMGSDMKVYVSETMRLYPDMSVYSPASKFDDKDTMHHPLLIAEILSDVSRNHDKAEKRAWYEHIPQLRHYILLEYERPEITHFEKQVGGSWALIGTYTDFADFLLISLPDTQISVPLSRIYHRFVTAN